MATTATAPSAVTNGAASNSTSPAAGGRPQLKSSITGGSGGGNANRRSTQSPIDGTQRRNSSRGGPWQTNSQQQKYNGAGNPNSGSPTPSQSVAMKSRAPNVASGGESDTHDKHMHDRTLYLLISLVGKPITITLRSGARYLGILAGADTKNHDLGVAMKWVRLVRAPLGDNSDEKVEEGEYVGGGPEKTMIFEPKDLVDIFAERVPLGDEESQQHSTNQNGALAGTFRTDTDISGNLSLRERELLRWQPDEAAKDLSLEETNLNPGQTPGQAWNQFEANERLFGVKSDFHPDIYTTKLDRSHPLYQQREAMADKIAREIESSGIGPNMNPHLAEERGVAWGDDSGKDEEDRFGAVQRTSVQTTVPQIQQTNTRYTPPALRAPTGLPTVPGAPHDPAIIASQLQRPETLQQKQQQQASRPPPQITLTQQSPNAVSEEVAVKHKEKTLLPETIAPKRVQLGVSAADPATAHSSEAPLPQEVTENFKRFVHSEKERYRRGKAALVQRDRASKLEELKKFSREFTLKTEVPQDLVPILAKDKSKQAEIIEKAKQNVAKIASVPTAAVPQPAQVVKPLTRVPPPNSFAAKNPEEFHITRQQLLQGFPQPQQRQQPRSQMQQPPLSARLQNIADGRRAGHQVSVKSPVPIPEHAHNIPTGPASNVPTAPKSASPSSVANLKNLNAKALEFRPNPNAISFTPTIGGASTTATPSPTTSAHAQPSRAASPSAFFGNKKAKVGQGKLLIADRFNPFKRMKSNPQITTPTDGPPRKLRGNSNDYIERAFCTTPIWPTTEQNAEKKYEQMFGKPEFGLASSIHSPQPPHAMPHQPHHQQLPSHVPHINQPPHLTHQPHHPHMPHIGIPPPHYEQEQHLRQITPSVIPSPSLHNATVAPYQQSPVAHHSQLGPMYPSHQQAQYVPSGPGGPGFGYYNGGFRGAAGAGPMMVHGPQPIPYPGAGQFIHHPHMYSPQQPQAYIHGGPPPPPPPGSQGYPSPGRGAPMMMHQGSQQGTPAGPQMMQYAIQPGQTAPMYAGQGQQQSELLLHGQNWLPQRPQSTVSLPPVPSTPGAKFAFSRAASPAPSPRPRNLHMSPQLSSATAILSSPSAAYTPFPPASGPGLSSYALQRSQTGNSAMGAGGGRGRRHDSSGGSNGAYMAPMMMPSGFVYNSYSNDGPVGMMRGQPHPHHHQGSHPPQFYHGPQSHFPSGGRGSGFVPPQSQHQGGQHAPPPAPPQSQPQPTPAETEDGK